MIAISIPNRTIYDCILYLLGANMIAMSESRDYDFWTNLLKKIRLLQSYLVLFIMKIAIIFSPHDKKKSDGV